MLPIIFVVIPLLFIPQIWVMYILKKYARPIDALPGSGGALAVHLVKRFKLDGVTVQATKQYNDHYDPEDKTIRLSVNYMEQKSLAAIAIAAHEFGHALQDKAGYRPLRIRTYFAKIARVAEKIASIILINIPVVFIATKATVITVIMFLCGFAIMGLPILLHLVTLPVEFDASFRRALPILKEGRYLPDSALPVIRQVLIAAALTYLAASLASLLNLYRWIAILRR